MKCGSVLVSLCLFGGVQAIEAEEADTVVVENARVRLVFATKPVPFLQKLVQKPSQKNLLIEPADPNLFQLVVARPTGGNVTVESRTAKQGSIKVDRAEKRQFVSMRFVGLGPAGDMTVSLNGVLDDAEPFVQWSIQVNNPGQQKLTAVRFPYIVAVPAIDASDDDFIIAPAFPGAMIENPAKNWPEHYSAGWAFPGVQSVQFCAYQDRAAGVYMASMDTVGYNRSLTVSKDKGRYCLRQDYPLPETSAAEWKSPYDVVFGVTSGTWQQTADIYKRWAMRQPWCAKTLDKRDDVPEFWKRGPCVHVCAVRTHQKGIEGSYYPALQEHLRAFREKIDGPVLPLLVEWEKRGVWVAGDYFPAFDAADASDVIGKIRQDGFSPFVYLSGMLYTFDNDKGNKPIPGSERYADLFALDKDGKPAVDILAGYRHSYCFCPALQGTRAFFRSVIDQLHALGIDVIQMDQATSGAGRACYSAAHGHPPGPGPYQAQAFRELLADMRSHGRSLSKDFMQMNEELHEELIPYVDGFHTREYKEYWWYRDAPGARGIPLFTYLYHEYAIAYGGDSAGLGKYKNTNYVREHAVNLVSGKTPGAAVWSYQQAAAEAHPDQIHMLRNHSHLLKTEARRFLMLGRMLYPLEFDVPSTTFQIGVEKDKKWHRVPFVERAVLTSSWQSPEGLVGHCLVNVTDAKQPVRLPLDTRNAPGWSKADVDLYRADKPELCEHVLQGVALPHEYALELQPYEAVFFVIRPAKGI